MVVKKECEKCGRKVRPRCLHIHKPRGERRCGRCIKKYGQNKFYIPKEERRKGKFELTMDERQALFRVLISKGLNEEQAKFRINNRQRYLRGFKRNSIMNKIKEKESRENLKKKFLEGLGQ